MIAALYFGVAIVLASPVYVLLWLSGGGVPGLLVRLMDRAAGDDVEVETDRPHLDDVTVLVPGSAPVTLTARGHIRVGPVELVGNVAERIAARVARRRILRSQRRVDRAAARALADSTYTAT